MRNSCPRCGFVCAGEYPIGTALLCERTCGTLWKVGATENGFDEHFEVHYVADKPVSTAEPKSTTGIKNDDAKPALQYIPRAAMFAMGDAFAHGAKKYGAFNYRGGLATTRTLAAAVRHIYQFLDGEDLDSESGKSHLGHAMASLAMTLDTLEKRPDLDDRPKDKK